jgi:hypothetical protein
MTHPDPEIRAQYEADRAMQRRTREALMGGSGTGNGSRIGALWRRLPVFVRELTVAASLIGTGVVAQSRVGILNAERTHYKGLVDGHTLALDTLRAKTAILDPFARYMLCWTARQEDERPGAGCDRSLIGTPLWTVLQEERRQR